MATRGQFGAFVPTTNIWDVGQLQDVDVNSPEFKELLVRLYQNLNLMALVLNVKDTGYYVTNELVNGQLFFPNPNLNSTTTSTATFRQAFRILVNFGVLPNTGTKSIPHNIPILPTTTFTRIYATASDNTGNNFIPIPYASASGTSNIELSVNATDVTITTASNRSNFTTCYVVLEFLKS